MKRHVHLLLILAAITPGCASWFAYSVPVNVDRYRVGEHGWSHDSLRLRLYRTSEPLAAPSLPKITLECRSCNNIEDPIRLEFDASGSALFYIPEARQLISVRLHVHGSGIDTTYIQKQPPPQVAMGLYRVGSPLTGRILVTQFALLCGDTTFEKCLATAQTGDELNIFGEQSGFFLVHHPLFKEPLYVLKDDAVRIN